MHESESVMGNRAWEKWTRTPQPATSILAFSVAACSSRSWHGTVRWEQFQRIKNSSRCFDQSCITPIKSCRLSPYCESTSDEPSAGNLHAGFCGSRGRVTASGHPVGDQR